MLGLGNSPYTRELQQSLPRRRCRLLGGEQVHRQLAVSSGGGSMTQLGTGCEVGGTGPHRPGFHWVPMLVGAALQPWEGSEKDGVLRTELWAPAFKRYL